MKKILFLFSFLLVVGAVIAATSYTTHYDLCQPADGDEGWGDCYRSNNDIIDTQLYINSTGIQDHIDDPTGAHAATAISTTAGSLSCTSQTTVQAFLECLDEQVGSITGGTVVTTNTTQTITGAKTFTSILTATGGLNLSGALTLGSITDGVLKSDGSGNVSTGLVDLTSQVTGTLPIANGGTGASSFTSARIPYYDGSTLVDSTNLYFSSNTLKTNALQIGTNDAGSVTTSNGVFSVLSADNSASRPALTIIENSASINGKPSLQLRKRNDTSDVSNGDVLGTLSFQGYLSGSYNNLGKNARGNAAIEAVVDGAPSTQVPGRLNFYTGTSTANPSIRMHIDTSGNVNIAGLTASQFVKTDASKNLVSHPAIDLASSDVTGLLPYSNGGTNASTSWTQGSILFAGASSLAEDNSNLFWDDSNNRLGIGLTTPSVALHLQSGSGAPNYLRVGSVSSSSGFDFGIDSGGIANITNNSNTNLNISTNALQRLRVTSSGSVVVGNSSSALATNATDGFLYVSTSAGAPAGTPTTQTGSAPIHIDTTNNDFYFYSGSQWRKAGGAVSVTGSRQTGTSISVGTQISPTSGQNNLVFVAGNGGAVTVTASPPIVTSSIAVGTSVRVCGTSDTNTVTYTSGTSLVLNGDAILGKDDCLSVDYMGSDGSNSAYVETGRNF